MTRTELILQIALRMDEITPEAGLQIPVDGSDNNPLYELIDGLIDSGALELFSAAPYWRLPQKAFPVAGINIATVGDRQIIRLRIDDDFLRVAEIDCGDFQRPITEVFPEQSAQGKRQHNRFLMGREAKPVGVLSFGQWGGTPCREIDCYSLSGDSAVTASSVSAYYIANPGAIPGTGDLTGTIPEVLIPALEWLVAARAFGARGDANHAAICQQNAQNNLV